MLNKPSRPTISLPPKPQISTTSAPLPTPVTEFKAKLNKKGFTVKFKDSVPHGGALVDTREFARPEFEFETPPWLEGVDVGFTSTCTVD